ncbi:FAD:protein FMN transferase [Synechococcus sp. RC10B2]|uniref:FAD:protein FMN transferase n=1 Tax=Synechococcus sp. RC10B2 TaxID=2964530 RepID=UPI0039C5FF04
MSSQHAPNSTQRRIVASADRIPHNCHDWVHSHPMHQFTWRAMGTEFTLYLPDGEREWAAGVAGELQEETRRLERQLSLYLPDSDLCYLNAHAHEQPVRVEPELFRLLQICQSLYALTQGVFDPTVTPLLRLWGFVDKQYRVPDPDAIEQALERVGMELVLLEPSGCWVYYALPGVELSFGAIGKGWAIAQCVRILRELGVGNALVDAGGSTLYALGTPAGGVALTPSPSPTGWARGAEAALAPSPSPTGWERGVGADGDAPCGAFPLSRLAGEGDKGGEGDKAPLPSEAQSGWLIRLPNGSERLLRDAALAVAGDTEQYFEVNGIRYGHIIDPRTGYPAPSRPPVAVIGDDPTLCDALSTALYIEPALESIVRTRCRSVSVSTAIDGCGK